MVNRILQFFFAGLKNGKRRIGRISIDELKFTPQGTRRPNDDKLIRLCFIGKTIERFVLFKVHFHIVARLRQLVFFNPFRTQSHGIRLVVKHRFVIVCPRTAARCREDFVRVKRTRFQVFEINRVLPPRNGVHAISQNLIIRTYRRTADLKILIPLRHVIAIQHHFFSCIQSAFFATINGILLAFLKAGVVKIAIVFVRQRLVILLNTPFEFFKKLLLKPLSMLHHRLAVSIFGVQISDNFGVFALIHPVIIIDAHVSVCLHFLWNFLRNRWYRRWHCGLLRH